MCHSLQVCSKFSISFCLPFTVEKCLLVFVTGMNVFIFPLLLQYSCFHYSLHCGIHFYIGDQGLFLFFSFMSFVWLVMRVIQNAPEGSVVLKASVLWALPGYFLGIRRLNVIYSHAESLK